MLLSMEWFLVEASFVGTWNYHELKFIQSQILVRFKDDLFRQMQNYLLSYDLPICDKRSSYTQQFSAVATSFG